MDLQSAYLRETSLLMFRPKRSKFRFMKKIPKISIFSLLALSLIASCPVWCEQELKRLITPLPGKANSEPGVERNQCAATMDKYLFQPIGYEPPEPDSRSAKGKALYSKYNCAQCHSIESGGGELGPPLDGIGGHRGREWIIARLLDPEKQMKAFPAVFGGAPNIMPHMGLSKKDAAFIADYLLTLPEPGGGFAVQRHPIDKEKIADKELLNNWRPHNLSEASRNGRILFTQLHCGACHSVDGSADRFGPDLAGVGSRLSSKKLERILSGAVHSPVMKEQTESLGDERIYDLKEFLLTLPPARSSNSENIDR